MPFQCAAESDTGPVSVFGLSTEAMDVYRAAADCLIKFFPVYFCYFTMYVL